MKTLGDRLKYLREIKGLKQIELANAFKHRNFNITSAAISQYEANKRTPDVSTLKMYADYFEVSIDYLLGRTDNKKGIVAPEGNLHKNNIIYKDYNEIIDQLKKRLIEENIIEENTSIPKEVLEKIITFGQEAAIEILKAREKQGN